jgi:hypothetical protein
MRWICLLVVFAGCATPRYERTNIEFKVEVLQDFYPKAYLSGRATSEIQR